MNNVVLIGRLTRDPELRSTQSGSTVCHIGIAVDRRRKRDGEQNADFFNCTAWGKTGETIAQYFHKGKQIAIEGQLRQNSWTDKNGNRRNDVEVAIDRFDFIGSKNDGGQNSNYHGNDSFDDFDSDFMPLDDSVPF